MTHRKPRRSFLPSLDGLESRIVLSAAPGLTRAAEIHLLASPPKVRGSASGGMMPMGSSLMLHDITGTLRRFGAIQGQGTLRLSGDGSVIPSGSIRIKQGPGVAKKGSMTLTLKNPTPTSNVLTPNARVIFVVSKASGAYAGLKGATVNMTINASLLTGKFRATFA